jgi:polynucleotide 5'-kinase involved in rRNA processing
MAEIMPTDAFFVGSTTPDCFENRVMIGTEAMIKKAESLGIEALFVDTTGWVYGFKARELKKSLIELIQPDLLVVIERERELEHLIRPFFNSLKVLRMPVSPKIRYRDRTDRKFLRESMLSKQLSGSDTITFHFKEISFFNSFLNTGEIVTGTLSEKISEIIEYVPKYVELCSDVILIAEDPETPLSENTIEKFKEEFPHLPIQIISAEIIENVLVGLIDFQNTFLGYGIITNIDFIKHQITIYTPVSKEQIASIQFGSFKVTPDGRELCWIHPWAF